MKKSLLALAALGTLASVAHAQSSVTLYGIVDEGLQYTSNDGGKRAYQLTSGVLQGSRFGLKGTEDLGNGLKAIFQLENGFNVNTGALGQGGRMFGRQAYVGLSSDTTGTVTMGRQYDSVVDYLGPLTANGSWGGALFSHPLDNDNTDNSFRVNNAIKYASPNFGGFSFGGLYGFSNEAGGFADNRAWSIGARYNNGPFSVAAAFMNLNNPGFTTGGAVAGTSTSSSVLGDATFAAQRERVAGIGANYTVGIATIGAVYTNTNVHHINDVAVSARYNNFELNAKFAITPAFTLGAMYDYTKLNGSAAGTSFGGHWNEGGVMADYYLSKRTDVYGQVVYEHASQSAGAHIVSSAGVSTADNQTVVRIGLRHKF